MADSLLFKTAALCCLTVLLAGPVRGQSAAPAEPGLCPPPPQREPLPAHADPRPQLSADELRHDERDLTDLRGNVLMIRDGRRIRADWLRLEHALNRAQAEGNVSYDSPDYRLRGAQASFDLEADSAAFSDAEYAQFDGPFQGRAETIARLPDGNTRLTRTTLSGCPPGQEDWVLEASEVELDHGAQQGTARDAVLRFKGVPLLYSPWFRFPIGDARQSGFLTPAISFSDSLGTELAVPWYWNIAPQADATLTPRYFSERGVQLQSEWRALTRRGTWQLDSEYLDDRRFGAARDFARLRHAGRPGANWTTSIDASNASDKDYFDDLGNSLDVASIRHLERRADLTWFGGDASVRTRVQSYQTLDASLPGTSRPYQRLPQVTLGTYAPARGDFDYGLDAEAVNFERDGSLTGQRLDLRPHLYALLGGAAWFLTPGLELRHTRYQLDGAVPGAGDNPERTVPIVSLDTGLFFERRVGQRLQTLEPRLFYLYVPNEEQSDLPVFDTGQYTFSFAQLFRADRFTSADRVGDANQLSLALSTRLLDPASGAETFRAGIGQIVYFRDREVTLPGAAPDTRSTSDAIAEAGFAPDPRWDLSAAVQYNPETETNDRSAVQLQFRDGSARLANFAYRYRRDLDAQADTSWRWRVAPRWILVGRWNHSVTDDQVLEAVAGFEYESCCWVLRTVARERLRDEGEEREHSIYLQLVLKGLGGIGPQAGSLLEHAILGYRDDYY